ncbi:MAG: hypothetical protein JRJ51_07250 [Deltaproteobacteria bacterium]|nr:hypothetical protein [Deltaproteobacteria bacterium]
MAATARRLEFDEDAAAGSGNWGAIQVPAQYPATLKSVEDYDNGNTNGWIFTYEIGDTGLTTKTWITLSSKKALWYLVKVCEAHDYPIDVGLMEVDPNALIGDTVGILLDFDRDSDGEPTGTFRNIQDLFPLPADGFLVQTAPLVAVDPVAEDVVPF